LASEFSELLGVVVDGGGAGSCGRWQRGDGEGSMEACVELERVASGELLRAVADGGGAGICGWRLSDASEEAAYGGRAVMRELRRPPSSSSARHQLAPRRRCGRAAVQGRQSSCAWFACSR
jgi:hypothetical protein